MKKIALILLMTVILTGCADKQNEVPSVPVATSPDATMATPTTGGFSIEGMDIEDVIGINDYVILSFTDKISNPYRVKLLCETYPVRIDSANDYTEGEERVVFYSFEKKDISEYKETDIDAALVMGFMPSTGDYITKFDAYNMTWEVYLDKDNPQRYDIIACPTIMETGDSLSAVSFSLSLDGFAQFKEQNAALTIDTPDSEAFKVLLEGLFVFVKE